ncbi:MAG TPA: alpha/beta hydrolase domain-containing protein [Candidatus Binatia bacterium]|nr:alpha/beta hydrolase domain-containing protein [Candidatus Binatia bacterium]
MVTAFDLSFRRPLAGGQAFGDIGPYEELRGWLRHAVDPRHPANARITDLALAPCDEAGRVAFSSDVSILLPVDRGRARGRLLVDVVNRGNTVAVPNFNRATRPLLGPGADPFPPVDVGDGFLMRRGYVVISCGWQGDLPDVPGLIGLEGPDALAADGRPLRGLVYVQLQATHDVSHFVLADRVHRPYPAADLAEPGARLLVRDQPDAAATEIPRERWRFARAADGHVVPDPCHVHLDGGFERGRIYQVVYTGEGAGVRGIGMAALRDAASWLKHGTEAEGNPVAGHLRWAYAYGRSQTGRLLRTLVYEDLNVDEAGREALDGIIANVAGGMRGEFNQRFGQNSKDRPFMMSHLFPFTDTASTDAATGATGALHARIDARGSRLRVFYTNSSSEYHRGDASLIHTDPGGARDHPHGPWTRVYHFAGTEHGLGIWPPSDTQPAPADPSGAVERSRNLRGVADYAPLLRACLVNMDRWVAEGVEPPPSQHPRLADGTAVAPAALVAPFDRIPGAHYPRHHAAPRRQDFRELPPRPGAPWGSRVSAVDADGNEVAGIALPEIRVPLATHAGWSLRHKDIGGEEQLLVFAGATVPFARTPREREASCDPRPSIEERYSSRDDYLTRVRAAALELAGRGHLLPEDVELSVAAGARFWDHFACRPA